jgi:hypothetical protein
MSFHKGVGLGWDKGQPGPLALAALSVGMQRIWLGAANGVVRRTWRALSVIAHPARACVLVAPT